MQMSVEYLIDRIGERLERLEDITDRFSNGRVQAFMEVLEMIAEEREAQRGLGAGNYAREILSRFDGRKSFGGEKLVA